MLLVFVVAVLNFALGYALSLYLHPNLRRFELQVAPAAPEPPTAENAATSEQDDADIEKEVEAFETWQPDTGPSNYDPARLQGCLDDLQQSVARHRAGLIELDRVLRAAEPHAVAWDEQQQMLTALGDRLIRDYDASDLQRHAEEAPLEQRELIDEVQLSFNALSAVIETTNGKLARIDAAGNLESAVKQLRDETSKLLDMNFSLRDRLEEGLHQLTDDEGDELGDDASAAYDEELAVSLFSRRALMARLQQRLDPARESSPGCAALIDIDHCRRHNESHGPALVNRMLAAICQAIVAELQDGEALGRTTGAQFCLVLEETDADAAAQRVDAMRRRIEQCRLPEADDLCVTATASVLAITPGETSETFHSRLSAGLQQAKLRGRNLVVCGQDDSFVTVTSPGDASAQQADKSIEAASTEQPAA